MKLKWQRRCKNIFETVKRSEYSGLFCFYFIPFRFLIRKTILNPGLKFCEKSGKKKNLILIIFIILAGTADFYYFTKNEDYLHFITFLSRQTSDRISGN